MKYLLIFLLLSVFSCNTDKKTIIPEGTDNTTKVESEISELKIYDYDGLKPLINKTGGKVYVVNFWATWCAPCVKELPYFEMINDKYNTEKVEVLLVSLDFPKDYDTKLIPFIDKHKLQSKVVAFDDTNQNKWIPAINKDWSGALPATIIYSGDKRQFYERSFTQEELETELKQFLK